MSEKYFADDRFIISDEVKNMSKEERKREITRLENEIKDRKRKMEAVRRGIKKLETDLKNK